MAEISFKLLEDVEYTVVDNKVTINNQTYTVVDDKVTINGIEYDVVDDKLTINEKYSIDDIIILKDAFSCKIELQVLIDGEVSNNFETIYGNNDDTWLIVRKTYGDENNGNFTLYVDNNYTNVERYFYLSVRDNKDGDISTITLRQPACYFDIEVADTDYMFDSSKTECIKSVKVYGASKEALVSSQFIDIIKDGEIYDYDNSLSFTLQLKPGESTEKYNMYYLTVKFLGKFNDDLENYKYSFNIRHKDNVDTVKTLYFNLGVNENFDINKLYDDTYEEQKGNDESIANRNDNNKISSLPLTNQTPQAKVMTAMFKKQAIIVRKEGISDIVIANNTIILQTNVYNSEGEVEHNSMILLQPKALWCKATSEYKNNLHYINVSCDNNFWGTERKTILVIKNAEDIGSYKRFWIKQNTNNEITIEESVNS